MASSGQITVSVTVAEPMLRMRFENMRDQIAEDDALCALLGRQVLAKARTLLLEETARQPSPRHVEWGPVEGREPH